jgi:hypothetical protein
MEWLASIFVNSFFKKLFAFFKDLIDQAKLAQLNVEKGQAEQSAAQVVEGEKVEKEVETVAEKEVTDDEFDKRAEEGTL